MIKASQSNDEDLRQLPRIDSHWNGRPLVTLGMSKKSNILRNLGIIKLFAGQHQEGIVYTLDSSFLNVLHEISLIYKHLTFLSNLWRTTSTVPVHGYVLQRL